MFRGLLDRQKPKPRELYSPAPWGAQGFVCDIKDIPATDLMRVVDRNGHMVGYGLTGCCEESKSTVNLPERGGMFNPNGLLMCAAPDLYELVRDLANSGVEGWSTAARALIAEIGLENTRLGGSSE